MTIASGDSGVVRNVYDVTGRRVLRVEPDGSKTIYLGSSELRWTPGDPTIDVARHYPGGTHRQFDGSLTYTVSGHQGSVVASVDAATGAATYNRYLPYGELRAGATVDDQGFLGQTHDDTTNLVYLNNRYHDPTLGQFISVDPLVAKTGQPYIYGAASPITYSDPLGLEVCYDDPNHPKYGQCYEAADGEEWSMTPEEEVLTVNVPNTLDDWMDPSGSLQSPVNVRNTALDHVTSARLVDTWRYLTSMSLTDSDRLAQLHLMLCDCGEIQLPDLTHISLTFGGCVVGCAELSLDAGGLHGNLGGAIGLSATGPSIGWSQSESNSEDWPWTVDVSNPDNHKVLCGSVFYGGCFSHSKTDGASVSITRGFGFSTGWGMGRKSVDLPWFW